MTDIHPVPDDVDMTEKEWRALSAYQRWYQKNRESHYEDVKDRREELRDWIPTLREGWECEQCGADHPAVVQFHHTDQNEYDLTLWNMANDGFSKETIRDEVERGRILCSNCHNILHYEEGTGKWSRMDDGPESPFGGEPDL